MTVHVDVLIRGRTNATKYHHQGMTFVEGRRGSEYSIRLRNDNRSKVKAVVSVDGINVLTGDRNWTPGYVVGPYEVLDIPGWRIDGSKVSSFEFSSLRRGYSQDEENVGVIGVRVYHEVRLTNSYYPINVGQYSYHPDHPRVMNLNYSGLSLNNITACSTASATLMNSVGNVATGWGEEREFHTHEDHTRFNESLAGSELHVIYYDDKKGLEARGVLTRPSLQPRTPDPFPGLARIGCPYPESRR